MKKLIISISLVVCSAYAKNPPPVFSKPIVDFPAGLLNLLDQCKADFAILYPSSRIDENPKWKKDGSTVAINTARAFTGNESIDLSEKESKRLTSESWEELDLSAAQSDCFNLQGKGVLLVKNVKTKPLKNDHGFVGNIPKDGRTLLKGGKVFRLGELGKVQTGPVKNPSVFEIAKGENCHSPVLSPKEGAVVYICEQTGLVFSKF